jgi:integrase
VVTLCGKDLWLGKYNSPESRQKYNRLVAEWLANGRTLPVAPEDVTIVELVARFWTHAETFYRHPDGTQTGEAGNFKQALRPLNSLYGDTRAADFGPKCLRAIQNEMIRMGWARNHINKQLSRIKTVFRWAAERELIPGAVYHALRSVAGLKAGRSEARETEPVRPVPEGFITAIESHVSAQVWAMIQVQLLTGCRPGEVVVMRTRDLNMSGKVWTFAPQRHKGQHRGHGREIRIGPKAQAVIKPFLKSDLAAFIFSPADADLPSPAQPRHRHFRRRIHRRRIGRPPGPDDLFEIASGLNVYAAFRQIHPLEYGFAVSRIGARPDDRAGTRRLTCRLCRKCSVAHLTLRRMPARTCGDPRTSRAAPEWTAGTRADSTAESGGTRPP